MSVSYENSNIEQRDEWIRLLNKLRWLQMQVMLRFFAVTIWNIQILVRTHEAWQRISLYAAARILDDNPISQQLLAYLIDNPFVNQKPYKVIRMSYSLKYKLSKK